MRWPFRRTKKDKCWICGSLADSSEHKIKRSDIVQAYGKGSFRDQDAGLVGHLQDGKLTCVQSSNDPKFKYPKSLCQRCNNSATQPFDMAYETFSAWAKAHREQVLDQRMIDLKTVFGEECVSEACPDLYKYFVKSFGCRLVYSDHAVPSDLPRLIFRPRFRTRLRITFAINRSLFYVNDELRDKFFCVGGLQPLRSERNTITGYVWHQQISWLRIGYWYNVMPWSRHGAPWTSDSSCLYLGDIESVSSETLKGLPSKDGLITGEHLDTLSELLCRRDPEYPRRAATGRHSVPKP